MDDFYIYAYLDTRKPGKYIYQDSSFDYEPFYIGKGKDDRWKKHLSESYNNRDDNAHKCNIIRKIKRVLNLDPVVVKIVENISEESAFRLETEYIRKIGRYDLKLGPLANKTDGGEGQSGFVFTDKSRNKISNANKKWAKNHRNPFAGKTHTKETKKIMSDAKQGKYDGENNPNFGKRLTEEEKKEIGERIKNSPKYIQAQIIRRKKYVLVSPQGEKIEIKGNEMLRSVCKIRGLSYYALLGYQNKMVPAFRKGHGFESSERKNTNGWSLIFPKHQRV